jgi:hypothetical protein
MGMTIAWRIHAQTVAAVADVFTVYFSESKREMF